MVEPLNLLGLLAAGVAHTRRPVDQQARVRQRTKIVEIELFRAEQRQFVRLEQVRQPLYTSGVGYWRNFAAELEPLRRALGDSLERFAE